eukprot:CAMPEP_0113309198 /NCGR_PEP_ID=MMETSP0010_2-20120614/7343_1 /TAXON_ID=216773 ORGANISM="Corethron hystrix, Strain 308" /NCGR_SAMPLE_ID=MMETSP0010_2 /ASSEMBLY_ACC=CAM_ASM_000155 /LENGTH=123 /DNA_ID=CAMNT_0000164413 /DNA_START=120 /DNA_END=488 /DNA_ORIENTATION=- /assembly_acc=CAM_ASM_000155
MTAYTSEGMEMRLGAEEESGDIYIDEVTHRVPHTNLGLGDDVHASIITYNGSTNDFMNEIMLLSKARPSHVQSGEHNENINGDILEYDAMGKRKKRVLLYKDGKGQLHNILLYGMTSGISSSW